MDQATTDSRDEAEKPEHNENDKDLHSRFAIVLLFLREAFPAPSKVRVGAARRGKSRCKHP